MVQADLHIAVHHPTPGLTYPRTGMHRIAATAPLLAALLTYDQAAGFVSHGPALRLKDRTTTTFKALSTAAQSRCQCRHPCVRGAAGSAGLSLSSNGANGPPSWRYEIDDLIKAASPWRGSIVETETILLDLVKRLPEVAKDVSDAAQRGALVSEVILAKGTEARLTVDGLRAVNRQLRQDIIPQALESAPRAAKAVSKSRTGTRSTGRSSGRAGRPTPSGDKRTGPMEGIAETLYSVKNVARGLTPSKIREGLKTVASEAENIVSRTPAGLYSPDYSVEDERLGFEVRRYASYAVCSAPMEVGDGEGAEGDEGVVDVRDGTTVGSGEGFNTLAGYLFGNNTQELAMDMTTPVNIDVSPVSGRTMSFVMPKDISAREAPSPRDPRVGVNDVAEGELLAVCEFPGFATDGEVKRQLDSLLGALEREATRPWTEFVDGGDSSKADAESSVSPWRAEDPSGLSYRLMQYNPPYTLPWLRTNAIAVKVSKADIEPAAEEDSEISVASVDGMGGDRSEVPTAASQA